MLTVAAAIWVFLAVSAGTAFLLLRFSASGMRPLDRLESLPPAVSAFLPSPSLIWRELVTWTGSLVPASPKTLPLLKRRLIRAGYRDPKAVAIFHGARICSLAALHHCFSDRPTCLRRAGQALSAPAGRVHRWIWGAHEDSLMANRPAQTCHRAGLPERARFDGGLRGIGTGTGSNGASGGFGVARRPSGIVQRVRGNESGDARRKAPRRGAP